MAGTLYLCATPIGNLEDMTFRAVRVLREADLIAAEDTRNSLKLLNHFDIQTPMTSYHEYNKYDKGRKLVEKLLEGKDVALITDAGTPGISDPGEELVSMCHEAGITVTAVPGAAACITALTISGLPTRRFAFEAFLPSDKKEREAVLDALEKEQRTIVLYEAPHRLVKTLKLLAERLGERRVSVCRELTKRHETVYRSTLPAAAAHYEETPPKGECVIVVQGLTRREAEEEERQRWMDMRIVVQGLTRREAEEEERQRWMDMSIEEHMEHYLSQGLDKKEAMKRTAKDRGVQKREIYNYLNRD